MTLMTEKDKRLLYALTLVVILFLFLNYLIFPQLRRGRELEDQTSQAEFERLQTEQRILSMSGKDKTIRQQQERLAEAAAAYYPRLTSQEIDREISGMLLENGLTVLELQIELPQEPSKLEAYGASLEEEGEQEENTVIYDAKIQITALGSDGECSALLNSLAEDCPAIRIVGYRFQNQSEEKAEADGRKRLRLDLELYMCGD